MDKVTKDANKPADPKPETKHTGDTDASGSLVRWNNINSDLKSALDTWTTLTDQLANKISPEEEQLREIKNILGTLKDKLNEFNDDK
ncbi:hypothetical protein [Bdellovibrio sp. HCB337]|uniref:hypothetical protein n=1 Tax=Bdellovibrio sp. HCB337 TaxID=3394358 RepID=UPI0039A74414